MFIRLFTDVVNTGDHFTSLGVTTRDVPLQCGKNITPMAKMSGIILEFTYKLWSRAQEAHVGYTHQGVTKYLSAYLMKYIEYLQFFWYPSTGKMSSHKNVLPCYTMFCKSINISFKALFRFNVVANLQNWTKRSGSDFLDTKA